MKKRILSLVTAVCMAAAVTGCGKKDEPADTQVNTGTNVSVYRVKADNIDSSVTYTGEIKASESAGVSAKAAGTAKSVNVELGSYVKAGDVLLSIDSTDYQLQYNQALAAYNSANAGYKSTVGGAQQQNVNKLRDAVTSAQNEYENASSSYEREKTLYDNNTNLVSARNALSDAKNNYDRTKSLYDMGAASETALESAKSAYENAQAAVTATENNLKTSLETAKSRLDNAKINLDSAKESYNLTVNVLNPESEATAKAQVASAKAALDIAKNALDNTTVRAPISGYISAKNISRGEMVSQGRELFSISDISSVEGEINVTETVISQISQGTPAIVSVKAAGIDNVNGNVSLVNTVKDEQTGLYTVRVNIPNHDSKLKAGMFAEIKLITSSAENTVTLPSEALMQEGDQFYVYKVNESDNTAEKVFVETGISSSDKTEITSGIGFGDTVVVSGKEYLSEKNNTVNITSEEGEANHETA